MIILHNRGICNEYLIEYFFICKWEQTFTISLEKGSTFQLIESP